MIKRVATLLGLIGLAGLLCLVVALTSGCIPVSQKGLRHELEPFHERMDGQYRQTIELKAELQSEIEKVWAALGEVAKGQRTIAVWAAESYDRLVQLERAGKITQRDLGLARSAIENLKKQMANASSATLKKVEEEAMVIRGSVINDGVATRGVLRGVDQKVDNLGPKIEEVDRKVETVAADAETAHTTLDQKVQDVGEGLSDQMGHHSEKIGEDLRIESEETRDYVERRAERIREDLAIDAHDLHEDHNRISEAVVEERKKALQDMKELLNIH